MGAAATAPEQWSLRATLEAVAGSARSGTVAWLPRRPDQDPGETSGPRLGTSSARPDRGTSSSSGARPSDAITGPVTRDLATRNLATRPFQFGRDVGPDPDPPLEPGALVGERWRVVRLLGEGGMGRVYEAEHTVLARRVAIKLLRRDAQANADNLARFQQEALAASRVGAPQIVEVVDFATHLGTSGQAQTYMVMELLAGESLEAWMSRPERLDEGIARLAELCDGLSAAHHAGVIHRDIKPANVFLRRPAANEAQPVRVKILDFGIAKVTAGGPGLQTQQGSLLGTPYYLAPERVLGEPLTAAADLYSVGVIFYEMLTGNVPFVADSFMAVLAKHVQMEPLDPRQAAPERPIPDRVAGLCMALLAKQPSARPSSAEQLADELRSLLVYEGPALAAVVTGPRGASAGAGADTQVLDGTPLDIHERATAVPGAMGVQAGTSSSAVRPEPLRWRGQVSTSAAASVVAPSEAPAARATTKAWLVAVVVGVVVALVGGVGVLAASGGFERDTPDAVEHAVEPSSAVAEPTTAASGEPISERDAGSAARPDTDESEAAIQPAPSPGAGEAPSADAMSSSAPKAESGRKRKISSKPKPASTNDDSVNSGSDNGSSPTPEPESKPSPEPKPIDDPNVPTIKDDIYD